MCLKVARIFSEKFVGGNGTDVQVNISGTAIVVKKNLQL